MGSAIFRFTDEKFPKLVPSAGVIQTPLNAKGAPNASTRAFFWNDANNDGQVSPAEYEDNLIWPSFPDTYWGNSIDDSLTYTFIEEGLRSASSNWTSALGGNNWTNAGGIRMPVKSWDAHKNPVYDGRGGWVQAWQDDVLQSCQLMKADYADLNKGRARGNQTPWPPAPELAPPGHQWPTPTTGLNDLACYDGIPSYSSAFDHADGNDTIGYWVTARDGWPVADPNWGPSERLSYFEPVKPASKGTSTRFQQKWRVGRAKLRAGDPVPGEVYGCEHVTRPFSGGKFKQGLVGLSDQGLGGYHFYAADSGLYIDTLLMPSRFDTQNVYGTLTEWFGGAHHYDHLLDKLFLRMGKWTAVLYSVNQMTLPDGDLWKPIASLPAMLQVTAPEIQEPTRAAQMIRHGKDLCWLNVTSVSTPPTLDGKTEAGWSAGSHVNLKMVGAVFDSWQLWDQKYLYVRLRYSEMDHTFQPKPLNAENPEWGIFLHDRAPYTDTSCLPPSFLIQI